MALSKIDAVNFLTGTIPQGNVANASLGAVTALPAGVGGKVLQAVTATDQTARTTTSTSFVTASNTLTVNITPSSSSNKVYVIAHFNCYGSNSNTNIYYTLYRGSTNLGNGTNGMALHKPQYTTSFNTASHNACIQILDEPSSSSQQTYQVYFAAASGTAHINYHSGKSVITAMEVSA